MERRLYFLLPDVAHTRAVVAKLETNGIERKYTHVIAPQGIDLGSRRRWRRLAYQRVADLSRGLPGSATEIDAFPLLADRHQ